MGAAEQTTTDPFGLCGSTVGGKYRIAELVGEGGFGVVYRGEHSAFEEPIAIKCLRVAAGLSAADRQELLGKLQEEGAVLHRLSKRCAAIVQALDVGAVDTPSGHWVPYLVLEWLEGETLGDRMARWQAGGRPPIPLAETANLLAPVADALSLAHRHGIAHRDVKPDNLFLGDDDGETSIKLLDFGIAKVLGERASFTASPTATAEHPGAFTPRYGAPEQFNKRLGATGPWTDVFALALVVVELCSGERALDGDDTTQLYVCATDLACRPTLRQHGVSCEDAVEQVMQRALAVDPHDRYRDAGDFWAALRAAMRGEVLAALPSDAGDDTGKYVARRGLRLDSDPPPAGGSRPTASSAPTVTGELTAANEDQATPAAMTRAAMTLDDFELAVIELARDDVELTAANVVAQTGVGPTRAERWLEGMVTAGRLRREERRGALVRYRVRGLTVQPKGKLARRLGRAQTLAMRLLEIDPEIEATLPPAKQKSVFLGVALGTVIPGIGLWYAAPFFSALLVAIFGFAAVGFVASAPLVGGVLSWVGYALLGATSGALGAAYTWHYNRHGKRTPLRAVRYRRRQRLAVGADPQPPPERPADG